MSHDRDSITNSIQLFIKNIKTYKKKVFDELIILLQHHLQKDNKKIYIKQLSKQEFIWFICNLRIFIENKKLNKLLLRDIKNFLFDNNALEF